MNKHVKKVKHRLMEDPYNYTKEKAVEAIENYNYVGLEAVINKDHGFIGSHKIEDYAAEVWLDAENRRRIKLEVDLRDKIEFFEQMLELNEASEKVDFSISETLRYVIKVLRGVCDD